MDDINFILNTIYTLYEIPMRCFYDSGTYKPGYEIQDADPLIHDINLRNELISKYNGFPILELENKKILYGICKNTDGITCIIGPIAIGTISGNELYQYKNKHGLLNYNNYKITNGSIIKTAAVLALLHKEMNHEQIEAIQIMKHSHAKDSNIVTETDIYGYHFQNSEEGRDHLSYHTEQTTMTAITNGNMDVLIAPKNYNLLEKVGVMANTPYRQVEYMTITAITLFARAAIDGGVNPDEAYNLSDLYLQKVATCQDELGLFETIQNAMKDFCKCVIDTKAKRRGLKYIEHCKRYVAKHLYHPFTLDDLADAVGYNKCYLTHQFSLKEGKSLKRYIHEERIKAAQNMLKYSEQPIPVIVNNLCFETQSHFGSIFKKITGTTPALYRLENKNIVLKKSILT